METWDCSDTHLFGLSEDPSHSHGWDLTLLLRPSGPPRDETEDVDGLRTSVRQESRSGRVKWGAGAPSEPGSTGGPKCRCHLPLFVTPKGGGRTGSLGVDECFFPPDSVPRDCLSRRTDPPGPRRLITPARRWGVPETESGSVYTGGPTATVAPRTVSPGRATGPTTGTVSRRGGRPTPS